MRVFKHYIPLSLLVLGGMEAVTILAAVYAVQALTLFRFESSWAGFGSVYPQALVIALSIMITFYVANLYDLNLVREKGKLVFKIVSCYLFSAFIIAAMGFIIPFMKMSRREYIYSLSLSLIGVVALRLLYYALINTKGFRERVLIIGNNDTSRKISRELRVENGAGYEVIGIVTEEKNDLLESVSDYEVLGRIEDLQRIAQDTHPDTVVVALSERRGAFPVQEILNCKLQGIRVEDWPSFYEKLTGKILIQNLRPSWLIFSDGFERTRRMKMIKWAIDTLFAVLGLCLSLPLMICIAILTKLDSAGPIIFRQERVGEKGRIYSLCKFRTMVADAEKDSGPVWSQTVDPRVTRLGKLLRRTGMDEIPQLFNVLRGDMSFVGPRPERPHFVSDLQKHIPYYNQRLVVKPGITGWAQVRYGYGSTIDDAVEKLQYDLYYIKNMSIFLDLLIMLSTVHKVLFAKVAVQSETETALKRSTSQADRSGPMRPMTTEQGMPAVSCRAPDHAVAEFSRVDEEF